MNNTPAYGPTPQCQKAALNGLRKYLKRVGETERDKKKHEDEKGK